MKTKWGILTKFQSTLKDHKNSTKDIQFVIAQCVKNIAISIEKVDENSKQVALEPLCRLCIILLQIDDLRCWSLSVNSLSNL